MSGERTVRDLADAVAVAREQFPGEASQVINELLDAREQAQTAGEAELIHLIEGALASGDLGLMRSALRSRTARRAP